MAKATSTVKYLESLGFSRCASNEGLLRLTEGNLELVVSDPPESTGCSNLEVLGGYNGTNDVRVIAFHIPRSLACSEQGAAWLSDGIGLPGCALELPAWFNVGWSNRHLLPIASGCYCDPLQKCELTRDTARLLRTLLRGALRHTSNEELVTVSFDGRILKFEGPKEIEVVAAGRPWKWTVAVSACCLSRLPARFSKERVTLKVARDVLVFEHECSRVRATKMVG
jgi:hypothetical protein